MPLSTTPTLSYDQVLSSGIRTWRRGAAQFAAVVAVILLSAYYVGLFDGQRLAEGVPSIAGLMGEMFPPNF